MRHFVQILFGCGCLVGATLSVGVIGGCASDGGGGAGEYREEFAEVFGGSGQGGSRVEDSKAWAVLLGVYSGAGALERAERAAANLRETAGLGSARAQLRAKGAVVLFGGYDSPEDRGAQRDLARIKAMEIDSSRPFSGAFLSPQGGVEMGSVPELSLLNAKEQHGQGAKYTLQVGVYESTDRREAMGAAEQAAVALRQDGEMAFYYHGPTKSMVTVGLFGDRDYDPATDRRSGRLIEAQRRFPNNMLNGRTIIERRAGGERTQPSALVQVPGGE